MNERRLRTLKALCDTFVPPVRPPAGAQGLHPEFWARRASDLGVHHAVADHIQTRLPAADRDGLWQLVDLLAYSGFQRLPGRVRESEVLLLRRAPGDVPRGLQGLLALTMMYFYGMPVPGGANPNWQVSSYPGPPQIEPLDRGRIAIHVPEPGAELEADVCVVGSGAGGAVVAAEAAAAGLSVVIVEAGGYVEPADVAQDELTGFRDTYWRGFPTPTADGTVTLLAGAGLGGGTVVNWMNCVRPHEWVRAEWAKEHGLAGLDGPAFDEHLDAVGERISVNTDCSDYNDFNSRLIEGADELEWSWRCAGRNADPSLYDPETAGQVTFGDRSGSKQDVLATYLRDAAGAGARILVHTKAMRIVLEQGRAAGVAASYQPPGATPVAVAIRARHVVAACGPLETPALLLRSGIGGPAVGRNLHLHPVATFLAVYPKPQAAWWGPPQSVIVDEFADRKDGYGFLLEAPHFYVTLAAALLPWWSAREHKLLAARVGHVASSIALVRDRGAGQVSIDDNGEAVVTYPLDDPLDVEHLHEGVVAMAKVHQAAGATAMLALGPKRVVWRRDRPLGDFLAATEGIPFRSVGGWPVSNAHQMGSARMGTDPATSVADPEGQIHDVPGVWIGDASAFPSASGVNPMLTCMALARRTAQALIAAG